MIKIRDYQNNVMKTGVLYGISHANRLNYWLSVPYCLASGIDDDEYGFCDDGRSKNSTPKYAFKFYDDSWKENQDIEFSDDPSVKTYFINEHIWDEKKKEYVELKDKYLKTEGSASILNNIRSLLSKTYDKNNPGPFRFKFSNVEDSLFVKIAFKDGNLKYDRFFTSAVTEEDRRGPNVYAVIETVKYYSDNDLKITFGTKHPMRELSEPLRRQRAESFVFEPVSNYDSPSATYIGEAGEKEGVIGFWAKKNSENSQLEAKVIKNENLPINANSKELWQVYADGVYKYSLRESDSVSYSTDVINKNPVKGNNFIVTNKKPIELFRKESTPDNPGALTLYKLGNTLLAKTGSENGVVDMDQPIAWSVFVDGKHIYAFFNQDYVFGVKNTINASTEFKGTSFVVSKKDSFEGAVESLVLSLYKDDLFQEINDGINTEKINEARLAIQFIKNNRIYSQLVERAQMLLDGDKLKIKEKSNGRALEDSILIGLSHIDQKFVAVDLKNTDEKSTLLRQANTHYSFTLYEKGTKNILETISVQKGQNIDDFVKEINKIHYLYGDIVKFYHSDGHKESILDVYTDNIKESERLARIRYFIVAKKGFQEIFHIKNWETTSYYIDGVTFSQVPQGKKMKYRVVLNGNDIGTSYPYQTDGKGTDTILFTQDYYDMEGWGVSKHDNHIVVFAIDPDTGLEFEIAHHEPSQTRDGREVPSEHRHYNIQMNFYNSICNIYKNKEV